MHFILKIYILRFVHKTGKEHIETRKKEKNKQIRKLNSCCRFNFCMQPTIMFLKGFKPNFRSFKLQLNTELIPKKAIEVLLCE